MQVDDGGQELPHDGGGFTLRQLASRNDIVKQLTATNIAHDNVQGVFILHTRGLGYHRQKTRVSIELLLFFAAGGVCVSVCHQRVSLTSYTSYSLTMEWCSRVRKILISRSNCDTSCAL